MEHAMQLTWRSFEVVSMSNGHVPLNKIINRANDDKTEDGLLGDSRQFSKDSVGYHIEASAPRLF
jgi:hypothetical protein